MLDHIGKEGYGEREDEQMEAVGETADGDTDRHDSACRGTAGRLFGRDFYAEDGEGIPCREGCGFPVGAAGLRDKYKDAVDAFNKALAATDEKMPDTVRDLLLYRESAEYRGADYAAVIKTAESLIGMDEKMKEPYFYRGAAYLYQGEQDKAKTNFDYAVSLDPSNYSLYLNIYRVYNDNHLSAVGDEYLQTALGTEPSDAEGYCQVGQIYFYLEQYDEAAKALAEPIKQVQSIDPSSTDSYNGLALCALAQDDVQTALQYITQGLALPGNEGKQDLYFNEVVAYEKSLDFLTAKDKCQKYVELYPTDEKGQRELTFLNSRN